MHLLINPAGGCRIDQQVHRDADSLALSPEGRSCSSIKHHMETMSQQELQAAMALLEEGLYQEAAAAIPGPLLTSQPSPPSLVFEILAAAGCGLMALELIKTPEGSHDRAAVEAARSASQAGSKEAPNWILDQVSMEVLDILLHWARGQRLTEGHQYYLGGLALRDILMELYERQQAANLQVQAAQVAHDLCQWHQDAAWLSKAWAFTQEPLVLARLLKTDPTAEVVEQARALLNFQSHTGPDVVIPALLHAAGNIGDLELVETLLAWPGLEWNDATTREQFRDAASLIQAINHPGLHSLPKGQSEDAAKQVRFNLLRAGALLGTAKQEQGRALAETALRSFARRQTDDYDIFGADPLVHDLVIFNGMNAEVYIDDTEHIQVILLGFINDQQATPKLQALALLASSSQPTVSQEQTRAAQKALELAGNDPWIRLWAHGMMPPTGNDLTDLQQLVDDLKAIPAGERRGHSHYPNTDGWEAQTAEEALAYHHLLLNLPEQQDDANDLTREWAFGAGQWLENLERFKLHAEAVEACRLQLSCDPESKQAQFSLSYHLLDLEGREHWDEAARVLNTYVARYPDARAAWNNLGVASNRLNHHARAAEAYERVTALGGDPRAKAWARSARERSQAERLTDGLALIPIAQSNEAAVQLGRTYWAMHDQAWVHTVKDIAQHYGLKSSQVAQQARLGVEAVNPHRPCGECGTLYRYESRSDVLSSPDTSTYTCPRCREAQRAREKERQAHLHARRTQQVHDKFAYGHATPLDLEDLTLRQATFLLALIRVQATEDFRTLLSLAEHQPANPLGASAEHSQAIIQALLADDIIVPHPSSPVEAFEWQDEAVTGTFLGRARYTVRGVGAEGFTGITEQLVRRLKDGPDHWPTTWQEELPEFWRELVQQEARAYLEFKLRQHNLTPKLGEKTEQTLRELSDDFSLGQIWNLTWQATQTAAANRQKDRVTNDHAVNIATSTLRRRGDHYRAEGMGNPKPSRRDFDMPLPGVSQVLFVYGLGFTEQGYAEIKSPVRL